MDADSYPDSSRTGETAAEASGSVAERSGGNTTGAPLTQAGRPRELPAWANGVIAGLCLYLFLSAINIMGAGLKTLGTSTDWLENLLAHAHNPFVALMGSVLVTVMVQSSSFTTSLIITLVAAGQMNVGDAIFAVMGANIGTSVTNTIVSFGNLRIRRQFRRAFRAAIVHDIFNWLTVAVLLPLEWITGAIARDGCGVLARFSTWTSQLLGLQEIERPNSPLKVITRPAVEAVRWLAEQLTDGETGRGVLMAAAGLLLLCLALVFMVKNLKGALLRHIEGLFRRVFFRNDGAAYAVGALTTVLVQSSSVTTSLIVPLAGAGAVKLKRVYPYTLGANLGTTVTGVIAASANPVIGAVTVAIAHVTFNLAGTVIWYPLRRVPIGIARWYGRLAAKSRFYALLFLFGAFIIVPTVGLVVSEILLKLFSGS